MTRYKLVLEYDGTDFVGWQRQANGASVQQALEEAIAAFTGEAVTTCAAGRTDAGVHALAQAVHVDLARHFAPDTVRKAVNFHLRPARIAVIGASEVSAAFDARFSALERRYLYRILDRPSAPALDVGRVWHTPTPLNVRAMRRAAQALVGRHDFTTFRSVHCQARSPVKTLDALSVTRRGSEVRIEARARSFLHRQVRAMVGTLKLVGEGKWRTTDVAAALAARERAACGPTAPACGLYLACVAYGEAE